MTKGAPVCSRINHVAIATILTYLCLWSPLPAGATNTIADAEARCGAAVKTETWSVATKDCAALVRSLSDVLAAGHGLSKADRLALEEGIVTYAAVTAHAEAEVDDLSDAKFYIYVASKELETATSDGLSTDSDRYRELRRAIDTAKSDLPAT
jgi:hypothetical protein